LYLYIHVLSPISFPGKWLLICELLFCHKTSISFGARCNLINVIVSNYFLQVEDDKIIVPRNSLVEVNQSGLLMETIIDITPRDPLPTPSVGPLDVDCAKEGLILCDKERIKGQTGVSLDALVGIFTRLGREMEEIGVRKSYDLAEKVVSIMEDSQPLLEKVLLLIDITIFVP
jgi:hypothetical protein